MACPLLEHKGFGALAAGRSGGLISAINTTDAPKVGWPSDSSWLTTKLLLESSAIELSRSGLS